MDTWIAVYWCIILIYLIWYQCLESYPYTTQERLHHTLSPACFLSASTKELIFTANRSGLGIEEQLWRQVNGSGDAYSIGTGEAGVGRQVRD